MSHYIRLLRLSFQNSFKKPQTDREWIITILAVLGCIVGLGAIFFMLYMGSYVIFSSNISAELELSIIAMLYMIFQIISLFFGMRISFNLFGSARDLPFLFSLPIRTSVIFASRATTAYLNELLTQLFMLFPILLAYMIAKGNAFSWFAGMIIVLLSPIIPLSVSSLITMFTSKIFHGRKYGEMISTILVLIMSLGLSLGGQIFGRYMGTHMADPDSITQAVSGIQGTLSTALYYPPANWIANSIVNSSVLSLALFVLINAVISVIFIAFGSNYYSTAVLLQGDAPRKKKNSRIKHERNSAMVSIMRTEFRCILRTPIYATNMLTIVIIGPFMLLVMTLTGAFDFEMLEMMDVVSIDTVVFLILAAFMIFISSCNSIFSTTLSREGKAIWIPLTAPVSPYKQIMARYILSQIFCVSSIFVMALVAGFVMPISLPNALIAGVLCTLASILPSFVAAIPDLYKPKLNWSKEQEAVKNNFNTMIGMLYALLLMLPQVIAAVVAFSMGYGIAGIAIASLLISAIEIVVFYKIAPKVANTAFETLQNS